MFSQSRNLLLLILFKLTDFQNIFGCSVIQCISSKDRMISE